MGVDDQGTSNGQMEPVMGHPAFPPPVVFMQPLPAQMQGPEQEVYKGQRAATLCGCCSDCCRTCCCPCVASGQMTKIVDEGQSSCCVPATLYGLLSSVGIPYVYSSPWCCCGSGGCGCGCGGGCGCCGSDCGCGGGFSCCEDSSVHCCCCA